MFVFKSILILAMTVWNTKSESNNRQLLIFGKERNEKMVKEQTTILAREDPGLKDRDLIVTVVNSGSNLYSKYNVHFDDFTVILVGKDGTEKFRTQKLLLPAKLFTIIDAMPMRKREMRRPN